MNKLSLKREGSEAQNSSKYVYQIENILPSDILSKQIKEDFTEVGNKCDIIDEHGKLVYDRYKYDLNSLFVNTPTFSQPNVAFKARESEGPSPWSKIAEIIFASKPGKITTYMDSYKDFNEDIERYKNLPFIFKKVNANYTRKSHIRKSRRGAGQLLLDPSSVQFFSSSTLSVNDLVS